MKAWIGSKWYLDNPRGQRLVPREDPRFLTDLDAMTTEEINASDFYTELLRPRGLGWCVGTSIRSPAGDTLVFSIEKAHAKGPVPRAVAEQLDGLRPHLARASLLSGRLGLDRAKSTVATLEAIGLPAAALAPDGRVVSANAGFLACEPRIRIGVGNVIELASAPAQTLLMEAISNTAIASGRVGKSIPVRAVGRNCLCRARCAAAGRGPRRFRGRAVDCLHDVDDTERKPRTVITAGAVRFDACRGTNCRSDHRRKIDRTNFVRERDLP